MLNTPGDDAHDGDLELDFEGLEPDDGPDRDTPPPALEPSVASDDCKPLDDDKEQIGYELYSWEAEELDALDDAVHELGLAHEWVSDGWELVVHAEDEITIDKILPSFHTAAAVDDDDDEDGPDDGYGDDDATDIEVVNELFAATTRLRKDPRGSAMHDFLDSAAELGIAPPFGVEDFAWERVVGAVDALIDGYHSGESTEALRSLLVDLERKVKPLL